MSQTLKKNTHKSTSSSVDAKEISQFNALADSWWDLDGEFQMLHKINPVRLTYIRDQVAKNFGFACSELRPLDGLDILDIGCGGGILSEPLARMGANVIGLDASIEGIEAAKSHALQVGLDIDYRCQTAEELLALGETYDVVVAMEIIEHVADFSGFLDASTALVRTGGLFFAATINRTAKSFAQAIITAEYLLRWVPRGTHDWEKFVKPSELARGLRGGGLTLKDVTGITPSRLGTEWAPSNDTSVNYLLTAAKN